ncbi:unnamed protein product [Cylicocyclus nassatus]|uniref:Uncharacterized protein n=1 Tax=Cylicocyclus nassatus TaxID=53992 RepID=A0AA36M5N7_CYLNA|nr:unnamed protein product [Cylicocyclus nassatus]
MENRSQRCECDRWSRGVAVSTQDSGSCARSSILRHRQEGFAMRIEWKTVLSDANAIGGLCDEDRMENRSQRCECDRWSRGVAVSTQDSESCDEGFAMRLEWKTVLSDANAIGGPVV